MRSLFRLIIFITFFSAVSQNAAATTGWVIGLRGIAMAMGWLMMIIQGIKWMIADSPNDRVDAKKGMMYIMVGLLVVNSACGLICLYCHTANLAVPTGIDCTAMMPGIGCALCN